MKTPERSSLDSFLRNMAQLNDWQYPHIKSLTGGKLKGKGLSELRWRSRQAVPYRIGGFHLGNQEFVMLIGFTHNKKKYDPPHALETILNRQKALERNEVKIREYKVIADA